MLDYFGNTVKLYQLDSQLLLRYSLLYSTLLKSYIIVAGCLKGTILKWQNKSHNVSIALHDIYNTYSIHQTPHAYYTNADRSTPIYISRPYSHIPSLCSV
jgi:hypothetical protein